MCGVNWQLIVFALSIFRFSKPERLQLHHLTNHLEFTNLKWHDMISWQTCMFSKFFIFKLKKNSDASSVNHAHLTSHFVRQERILGEKTYSVLIWWSNIFFYFLTSKYVYVWLIHSINNYSFISPIQVNWQSNLTTESFLCHQFKQTQQ